jgi:phosphate transport system protein
MDNSKIVHHISEKFNKELVDIHNKVLTMGGLVERQLELSIQAVVTGNMEIAELVVKRDYQIDALEKSIDQECMTILTLRQPRAFDLRLLIGVVKTIHELERIGNKAAKVAEMAIKLFRVNNIRFNYELEHMAEMVKGMLHDVLHSFARMTLDDVSAISERDQLVDKEYDSILRLLISRMMEDPRNITRSLEVLETIRALERMGDHVCYIAEHLVYMINGEDLRISKLEAKVADTV